MNTFDAGNGLIFDTTPPPKIHWSDAAAYVAKANAENRGGITIWRLPTVAELASLPRYDTYPPTMTISGTQPGTYMTSDELRDDFDANGQPFQFMGVNFDTGDVHSVQKTIIAYCMLVSGTLNTTLDWKLAPGRYCWGVVPAGVVDGWHIPSPNELLRLPQYQHFPVVPSNHPEMTQDMYWTNAECKYSTGYGFALAGEFNGGRCNPVMKLSALYVMLCKAGIAVPVVPPVVVPPVTPPVVPPVTPPVNPPTAGETLAEFKVRLNAFINS